MFKKAAVLLIVIAFAGGFLGVAEGAPPLTPFGIRMLVQEEWGGHLPVFDPDFRWVAYMRAWGTAIVVRDLRTSQQVCTFAATRATFGVPSFSRDGKLLAAPSSDGVVRVWEVPSGREVHTFAGPAGYMFHTAFSPDGRFLASSGVYGDVKLWDLASGNAVGTLRAHWQVTRLAFSPDGRWLAAATWENRITVWDVATGQEVWSRRGHQDSVYALEFSPDGKLLASGSEDTTIRLWDAATGKALHVLRGHTGWVNTLAFRPDGRILASGSWDTTIRFWDVAVGKEVHVLDLWDALAPTLAQVAPFLDAGVRPASVSAVMFSPDGVLLASGVSTLRVGMIHLWHVGKLLGVVSVRP